MVGASEIGVGLVVVWNLGPFLKGALRLMELVYFLLIGAVAGWLAGKIMKGRGFGLLGNMIVGVIGGILGGVIFDFLNVKIGGDVVGPLVTSVAGAVVLLFVVGLLKKD